MDKLQRNKQIGRIHGAKKKLGWSETQYREFCENLTDKRSCKDMSDQEINLLVDWMFYFTGRRKRQPLLFSAKNENGHSRLVRLVESLANSIPPEFSKPPLKSASWQQRTAGKSVERFDELNIQELTKLIEGLKSIYARAGVSLLKPKPPKKQFVFSINANQKVGQAG